MKLTLLIAPICLAAGLSAGVETSYAAPLYKNRDEVPSEARWRLEDIYADPEAWESDFKSIAGLTDDVAAMKGHVMDSPQSLLKTIQLDEKLSAVLGKLETYAIMRSHEDTAAEGPKARADRVKALSVKASEATAFIVPEILAADENKIKDAVAEEPGLKLYKLMLSRIVRQKAHTLSAPQEAILAAMGELAGSPSNSFSMLTDADMRFPDIVDEKGNKVTLTQESYGRYVTSPVRSVRQAAFEGIHKTFAKYANTLGAIYSASVKSDVTFARLRHYKSAVDAALFSNEIPDNVYNGLVDTVNANLTALHDYVALKKSILGVDHMEPWDMYAPMTKDNQRTYSYEDAKSLVFKALEPLGAEYIKAMKAGIDGGGWVDVYENRGKHSGAYSWGAWGTHPYMLLNYSGTYRDVSTLAHEGGHSMHTYFSHKNQPQAYADYTIFVAEVASTVNENLLVEYLLRHTNDKAEKIFLLSEQLELIRTTIYRQTLFAEFELRVHQMAAKGEPLTPQTFNNIWAELNKRYYGEEVGANKDMPVEWSRIPHFYNAFYVYQYATSLSAAIAISDKILTEGESARQAYFTLLKGGSSKDPISLLKGAGVDMSTPEPVNRALKVFARKIQELKALLEK